MKLDCHEPMGMFTGYPLIKKFDHTLEMCHLPSNEQQLLVILGYNREIKINCEKSKKTDSVVSAIV